MAGRSRIDDQPGIRYRPPEGKWKDGLFACFNQIAPSCVLATCLPCLGLALVAQRLGAGYAGSDLTAMQRLSEYVGCIRRRGVAPYWRVLLFTGLLGGGTIALAVLRVIGPRPELSCFYNKVGLRQECAPMTDFEWIWMPVILVAATVLFYALCLASLRALARDRLRLPSFGGDASGVADGILSLACFPLALAQLLRHLFDFRGPCDARWPLIKEDADVLVV